jgi:hypothetical protein
LNKHNCSYKLIEVFDGVWPKTNDFLTHPVLKRCFITDGVTKLNLAKKEESFDAEDEREFVGGR